MKIVILTRKEPRHIYFANRIIKESGAVGVVIEDPSITISSKISKGINGNKKEDKASLKREIYMGNIIRYIRNKIILYRNKFESVRNQRTFNNKYFGRLWNTLLDQDKYRYKIYTCPSINDHLTIKYLKSLNPDLLVVLGTSLVRRKVLSIPKLGALNLHTGVSPYYRGVYCSEWAIYNNDLDNIGVTIHLIDLSIDSGNIVHIGRPILEVGDTRESIFAKLIVLGTDLMIKSIGEFKEGNVNTYSQDKTLGKLYLHKEYNKLIEQEVDRKLQSGIIKDYLNN